MQNIVYKDVPRPELAKEKDPQLALSKTPTRQNSWIEPIVPQAAAKQTQLVQYSQNGKLTQINREKY